MDEALLKSGQWPNIALTPGTNRHAATGEAVEIPASARMDGACRSDNGWCTGCGKWLHDSFKWCPWCGRKVMEE